MWMASMAAMFAPPGSIAAHHARRDEGESTRGPALGSMTDWGCRRGGPLVEEVAAGETVPGCLGSSIARVAAAGLAGVNSGAAGGDQVGVAAGEPSVGQLERVLESDAHIVPQARGAIDDRPRRRAIAVIEPRQRQRRRIE